MKAVDLVVFDMVGTTVQSSPRIPEAFTRALETAGVQLTPEDITSIRGKSKVAAIRELLADRFHADDTEELIRNTYAAFKSYLLDCYRDGPVQPIEGASDVFTWCNEEAIGIALTTGFDRDLANLIVEKLRWGDLIDTLVCNDDVAAGRPAPDLILTAMERLGYVDVPRVASVGDTLSDLQAGANAGVGYNIGVLSGAHSREQLQVQPHTALIDSVADLPGVLSE
ncbi:MAG: phosphonatase-like hydrolase [Woeseiaceae bacterium]|nr:phosphonatase-like hydrolase [Woeseiaceae bacterium]NIP20948.1 phosphonatase-like hydrolase [Woeseiaceae bacterium]NIS89715.1 phosphonatase-like hydrolase [Woeseiaceae bacterium]